MMAQWRTARQAPQEALYARWVQDRRAVRQLRDETLPPAMAEAGLDPSSRARAPGGPGVDLGPWKSYMRWW